MQVDYRDAVRGGQAAQEGKPGAIPSAHLDFGEDDQGGAVPGGAGLEFAQRPAGERNRLLIGGGGVAGGQLI